MAEYQGDGQGKESFSHVVEVAGGAPQAAAQDPALAGLDVLRRDEAEELAVRPTLEGVFLQVGTARDAPAEQEQGDRTDEPDVCPGRRETRVRVRGHAPQREDEQPAVDHEAAPDQLEADILVYQVVGV